MSNSSTKIEWTNATWSPVTGCSKVSEGCKHCYAEREWARLSANPKTVYHGRKFTDVMFHPERLDQPLRWKKPRMIFVNSMSDLGHESIPLDFTDRVFGYMNMCRRHTFQILTKRPKRLREVVLHALDEEGLSVFPNVWLGVSVEDQETADERIPLLLETPAAVRFVSYEPALGPVDLSRWVIHPRLDWVIAGGESGPKARPSHPDWFRAVRDQCQAAGIPFFFKQWGEWIPRDQDPNFEMGTGLMRSCLAGDGKSGEVGIWRRVGKKRAGRNLDGREWNEYPQTKEVNKP